MRCRKQSNRKANEYPDSAIDRKIHIDVGSISESEPRPMLNESTEVFQASIELM